MEVKAVEKCILVLAANPRGTDRLELELEATQIQNQLRQGRYGGDYVVRIEEGHRVEDLSRYLVEARPAIVHLVGHGSATGDILLEDSHNQIQRVAPSDFAELFANLEPQVECVVLNSCFSLEMADALIDRVGCTIGIDEEMTHPVFELADEVDTKTFIGEFYQGLAQGRGYYQSFELGRGCVQMSELLGADIPRFIARNFTRLDTKANMSPKRGINFQDKPEPEATILYPVWYGTNRRPIDPHDITKGFSGDRDDRLHYGACQVLIPKSHKVGSVRSAWWQKLQTSTVDRLQLDRNSLEEMVRKSFWEDVRQNLIQRDEGERTALVFIHGFNVPFEESALRAAQIGVDLQVPGITAFYSWPSKGSLQDYCADEASIQASEHHIAQFLTDFVAESNAERVHIIAHSMGNRGLLRSLQRVATQLKGQRTVPFGQIFLAAPDEDSDVFKDLASVYPTLAERTTLYISAHDKALASSSIIHERSRVGFSPPITIVPGVDTIDVSEIDLTLLGHGYFSDARDVIGDMSHLLLHNTAPERRFKLHTVKTESETYWVMRN
jgi:esterase/lipase superfamily enzyme